MLEQWISVTLESDCALTGSSATIGGLDSLRYIPGATLLGVAASQLYSTLTPEDALRIFHSNGVRFGCALPACAGQRTIPWPASFVVNKGRGFTEGPDNRLSKEVRNLAVADRPERVSRNKEPRFLLPSGDVVELEVNESTRTAIGADGRVRDGFLFNIQAVAAPAVFLAAIRAERQRDLDKVIGALGGIVRLGRSRSAEFGRARIELVAAPAQGFELASELKDGVQLLLVTDIALRTADFLPTTSLSVFPAPEGWSVEPGRSFVEVRAYTPFNGKRMRPDAERTVLAQGSVLTLVPRAGAALDVTALRAFYANGVGDFRNEGLGEVLVGAKVMSEPTPSLTLVKASGSPVQKPAAPRPNDELSGWLRTRTEADRRVDHVLDAVNDAVGQLKRARISPSQWGQVRTLAIRAFRSPGSKAFVSELKDLVTTGVGALPKRWGFAFKEGQSLADLVYALVEAQRPEDQPSFALHLSSRMMRIGRPQKTQERQP